MGITVALTGSSGNMGRETLPALLSLPFVDKIKLLYINNNNERKFARKIKKKYGDRVEQIFGDVANYSDCESLVKDADYVVNLAAVIPPDSDHAPELTRACNVTGVQNLVKAVESMQKQPKFIHTSTVAVYGNRNYLHPWGRVGDPLLPSVYDVYAETKVKGEWIVLESEIENFVILRQTAILHYRMLTNNMKDGLMFHTCFNVPLEWVTARDSGLLIKNIIKRDYEENGVKNFWKRCFNIGGGARNRVTGYDTFNEGFEIIGGSTEKFMKPGWNSIRNFHGLWFFGQRRTAKYVRFPARNRQGLLAGNFETASVLQTCKILPVKGDKEICNRKAFERRKQPDALDKKQGRRESPRVFR
ncbi:MAG: NAD-dependent epimerase/dehydratase family protein [Clostridium sp.]|nr:MAG: NAD-dependent epimerase/dehydratase family protein [Clostridium sp.]